MKKVFIFIVLSIGLIGQCVQSKPLSKQNENQTKNIELDENEEAFRVLFENIKGRFKDYNTNRMKRVIKICQMDPSSRHHTYSNTNCKILKDSIDMIIKNDFKYREISSPLKGIFESSPLYVKASALGQVLTNTYSLIGFSALLYLGYADPLKVCISPQARDKLKELRQNIK